MSHSHYFLFLAGRSQMIHQLQLLRRPKFGMHESTRGKTSADKEWCPNIKAKLLDQDPTIYNLIDNATYAFPTVLPDACYSAYAIKTSDIITF